MRYSNLAVSIFCAWILWMQTAEYDKTKPLVYFYHTIINGFEVATDCQTQQTENEKLTTEDNKAAVKARQGIYTMYLCLPDTVDPRTPKR